jgi:HK97 gp10 family phage protein
MVRFTIKNGDRVQRAIQNFGKVFNDKVLLDVHKAAGRIVKKQLESAVPEGNNSKASKSKLARNVVSVRSKTSKTGVWVGFSKRGYYALFLEKGTKQRTTSGNSKRYKKPANRGRINSRPFVRKTYRNSIPSVVDYISKNYVKIVHRAVSRIKG